MSAGQSSPSFDPSATVVNGIIAGNGALDHDSTPETPGPPLRRTPTHIPPAQVQPLSRIVANIRANAGICTALIWGASRLAAAIEDPRALPRLRQFRNGLVGLVCAGGIVTCVVILDSVAEGLNLGIETAFGRVWRWIRRGEEQEEQIEQMDDRGDVDVFAGEEATVTHSNNPPGWPYSRQLPSSSSQMTAQHQQDFYRLMSAFAPSPLRETQVLSSPPPPPRQEYAHICSSTHSSLDSPAQRQRTEYDASSSQFSLDGSHASVSPGPSPTPVRRTSAEWEHFDDQQFRRHEQRLRAVNLWAVSGRRNRTYDEILKEVEEMDERDRGM